MAEPNKTPQICVCYDVYQDEILEAAAKGAQTLTQIQDSTYACMGCGGCQRKVEALIQKPAEQTQ